MLAPVLEASQRWQRMLGLAAQYRITRTAAHLEQFLRVTDAGERILPNLVPLSELPKNHPELSSLNAIETVLRSGWREAIQYRHADIPAIKVRVLAGFEVRVLGQVVTLTARPKDILALLALRLPRDTIAETLWPEADGEKSRNNLHINLHVNLHVNLNALRKALEPWGIPTHVLETGLARANVDLWELDRALNAGQIETVRNLYGKLLPGFDLDLIEQTRANLHKRVLEAVSEDAAKLETEQPHAAEDALEWLLSHEPTHEAAVEKLLELMLCAGRRVSAQRRCQEFAQRLQQEFGLEPAPEMRSRLT